MKRKTITLVVYMLVCISLVSVGFAAWVITGGESKDATGNVTASTVTDKSIDIRGEKWELGGTEGALTAGKINFGIPKDADNDGWLQTIGEDYEDLEAYFFFEVYNQESVGAAVTELNSVSLDLVDNALNDLVNTFNLIKRNDLVFATSTSEFESLPQSWESKTNFKSVLSSYKDTKNATSVYVVVKVSYSWGDAFQVEEDGIPVNKNPYDFFNAQTDPSKASAVNKSTYGVSGDGTLSYKDFAYHALNKLDTVLNANNANSEIKLTVTIK